MSTKGFASTKTKVIIAFSLLAFGLITAIYFSINSFNQISASVEILAQPNKKSTQLNQLLTDISAAESQIRAYTLTQEDPYLKNYEVTLSRVFSKIDTLRALTAYQPWQRKRIDSISLLMEQKISGLNSFMELKNTTDQQTFSAKALRRLKQENKDSIKINKALKTTEKQVKENLPSLPRVSVELAEKKGFFSRLFGNGNKGRRTVVIEHPDSIITTTRTEVSIDTIVITEATADTLMRNVRKILNEVQQEENVYRRQLTGQELAMLEKDQAIMDQIRKMILELDREEEMSSLANARRARSLANQASVIIFMISCAGLLLSLIFMILIVKDISRSNYYKKNLEIARQRSERLRQIKEQFLANMSHEIRTPLNAIIGFTEQLRKSPLQRQQKEQVKAISSSSDFLLAIVTDILDLSKIEAGQLRFEKKDFELRNLIEDTCHVTESKAISKSIQLVKDFPDEKIYICGDPFRLQQVLFNLLSNAIKFTEEGEVFIRFDANDNGFGKYVVDIEVRDTGIGISEEQLPYIFENFSQADESITRKYGGTGLGLSITKKLVDLQGGQITVESKKGQGSSFRVTIPFPKGDENRAKSMIFTREDKAPSREWSGKQVLLVEDDSFNVLLLKTILHKWGIHTEETVNGFEALAKIKSTQYDLVLTDINMPGMSGIELVQEIRSLKSRKAQTPVVAVTANAMRHDLKGYLEKGMDSYLVKPYTEKDLIQLFTLLWSGNPLPPQATERAEIEQEGESFNLQIFNQFAAGDEQAYLLLLQSFLENTTENLKQLHTLHLQQDYANLSELAHKMYPTIKHLEANRAAELLKQIEYFDRSRPREEFQKMMEELVLKIEEALHFVEQEVKKITKSESVNS